MNNIKHYIGFYKEIGNINSQWTKMPIPNSNKIPTSMLNILIDRIKFAEKYATVISYRGISMCRICNQYNGHREYHLQNYIWPEGYIHYIKDHNVAIDDNFIDFIMKFTPNKN